MSRSFQSQEIQIFQHNYGPSVLGIGGLLLRAKKRGLINSVKPVLDQIHASGYFLSELLKVGVLRAANEF